MLRCGAEARLREAEEIARKATYNMEHERTLRCGAEARLAVSQKWAAAWKKLAQFRGWPKTEHEKNRQGRVRAETQLAKIVEALTAYLDVLDNAPGESDTGDLRAALAAAQPEEKPHGRQ